MFSQRQIAFVICAFMAFIAGVLARPDSAGHYRDLPPGISHGGIPYGSVSGDVAAYFKKSAPSSRGLSNLHSATPNVDFSPIEQWL